MRHLIVASLSSGVSVSTFQIFSCYSSPECLQVRQHSKSTNPFLIRKPLLCLFLLRTILGSLPPRHRRPSSRPFCFVCCVCVVFVRRKSRMHVIAFQLFALQVLNNVIPRHTSRQRSVRVKSTSLLRCSAPVVNLKPPKEDMVHRES